MVPIHEIYLARCAAKAVVSPTTSSLATALGDALTIAGLFRANHFFVGLQLLGFLHWSQRHGRLSWSGSEIWRRLSAVARSELAPEHEPHTRA